MSKDCASFITSFVRHDDLGGWSSNEFWLHYQTMSAKYNLISTVPRLSYHNFEVLREEFFLAFQRIKVPKIMVRIIIMTCLRTLTFIWQHLTTDNIALISYIPIYKYQWRIGTYLHTMRKSWDLKRIYQPIQYLINNSKSLGPKGQRRIETSQWNSYIYRKYFLCCYLFILMT